MASRLHSAETLCKGMDRVGYANGDASMSDRKRQLQSMIEARQTRIAAIRRKLSNQASEEGPVNGICGAPTIAQQSGQYCAGNPAVPVVPVVDVEMLNDSPPDALPGVWLESQQTIPDTQPDQTLSSALQAKPTPAALPDGKETPAEAKHPAVPASAPHAAAVSAPTDTPALRSTHSAQAVPPPAKASMTFAPEGVPALAKPPANTQAPTPGSAAPVPARVPAPAKAPANTSAFEPTSAVPAPASASAPVQAVSAAAKAPANAMASTPTAAASAPANAKASTPTVAAPAPGNAKASTPATAKPAPATTLASAPAAAMPAPATTLASAPNQAVPAPAKASPPVRTQALPALVPEPATVLATGPGPTTAAVHAPAPSTPPACLPAPTPDTESVMEDPGDSASLAASHQGNPYWKLNRYFKPKVGGHLKCSPEALKMWRTPEGRKDLQRMFLEHGSFQAMELAIVRKNTMSRSKSKQGGWYTKAKLEKNEGYSKNMLIKAWAWAKAQSKIRVNEVHGEEEIYIVANESFDVTSTEVEEATQSGNITVQDDEGTLLATDLPDFDAPAAALISGGPNAAGGSSSSSGQAGTPMLGSTTGVMSFRMSFPTISSTQSPLQILPQFVEVLGKKLDKCTQELERLEKIGDHPSKQLAESLRTAHTKMLAVYDSLCSLLSEATVAPLAACWPPFRKVRKIFLWRSKRDEIQQNFVQCTKLDVALNALLVRGKSMKSSNASSVSRASADAKAKAGAKPRPKKKAAAKPKSSK